MGTPIMPVNGEKICTRCCKMLPVSSFGKACYTASGLNYWCFECKRAAQKESRNRWTEAQFRRHRKNCLAAYYRKKNRKMEVTRV